jgi:transposase
MSKEKEPERIELTQEDVDILDLHIQRSELTERDKILLRNNLRFTFWIQRKLEAGKLAIHKLRKLFFGSQSEKRKKESGKEALEDEEAGQPRSAEIAKTKETDILEHPSEVLEKQRPKGHGRMGADTYADARKEIISHPMLKAGDPCPEVLCEGRLYEIDPGIVIRIKGRSPAEIVRYEIEKLRCTLCGIVVSAVLPEELGKEKYDNYFKANLAVQKYFVAVPFYRQEKYHEMIHFPLPDATQFELVESVADSVYPVIGFLESLAANGKLIQNDDTTVKILEIMKENKNNLEKKRTGMFTSCIFAHSEGNTICLFYSSAHHAGENLSAILEKRDKKLPPIIQMCDALSANITSDLKTILCNCLAHGRRKFTEIDVFFPEECNFVLDKIGLVYKYDEDTKKQKLSDEKRLLYHQTHSRPVMETLKRWMKQQIKDRLVEPNSGLGKSIKYLENHWEALTRFLSISGAPLDNNVVERSLKLVIRCRKNSLFYRTRHGAAIGSILSSLIYTCYLSGKNAIQYLTVLQKYKSCVFKNPGNWLPWNYEATVESMNDAEALKVA